MNKKEKIQLLSGIWNGVSSIALLKDLLPKTLRVMIRGRSSGGVSFFINDEQVTRQQYTQELQKQGKACGVSNLSLKVIRKGSKSEDVSPG